MKLDEKTINKEKEALIIRKYQQYLKLEKALSANTLDAYLTDLDKLLRFLKAENIDMLSVTLDDLQRFAAGLHDIGIHPRSQARIMSGIKSFFHFLIMADYREDDPSELLEGPKIGFKLPEVLTVEEIDTIIATVDMSKKEGQRNRAILETLYSCGLRVSELCNLKLSELYFDEGFIKVEGKGSKQRLVPISPRAIKEIKYWLLDRNVGKIKKGFEDYVFLARWGNSISRIMVFHLIKELAEKAGITKISARTPSVIPSLPTCWKEARTCVPYNVCWDTNPSQQPKFIPISTRICCGVRSLNTIQGTSSTEKRQDFIKL